MTDTQPQYNFASRVQRARAKMRDYGFDGLYIVAGVNMRYLTGFTAYSGGWPIWLSALVLPVEGEPTLIISDMHYAIYQAKGGSWVQDVRAYMDGHNPAGLLGAVLREKGLAGGRIGVEDTMWFGDTELIEAAAPGTQVASGRAVLAELRMIKDAHEIETMRLTNQYSAAGFAQAREAIWAGRPEFEAAIDISRAMLEAGSERLGETGSQGGHFKDVSRRLFEPGDVIDVDISGYRHGYSADTARMVFVGQPSPAIERMYRVTVEAFERTMEVIRPGVPCEDVHRVCAEYMARHGYQQVWKVGHGVGLTSGHEAPLLEDGNRLLLQPGMIFTIDPGCFLQGGHKDLPIHVEDNVLVTPTGAESLTPYTKEMVVV